MNKHDREEFEKRLEAPDFRALYKELIALSFRIRQEFIVAANAPKAHELKAGKQTGIYIVVKPGQDRQKVKTKAKALIREIQVRAHRLSAFFPEAGRWRWQQIFLHQAFHGAGTVEKREKGGAPKGMRPETVTSYRVLAELYWAANVSQREFCREMGVSRRKLSRALKFVHENPP